MNPTIALTLILLFLMVAAGIVSGSWGYALGREALKGITQPDVRPAGTFSDTTGAPRREQAPPILKEADILADVKARINGRGREPAVSPPPATGTPQAQADQSSPTPAAPNQVAASSTAAPAEFPMVSRDQGVTLEVLSVSQQEGALIMTVNLQNQGAQSVSFLYSFMNVMDDQGNPFSANTSGLPAELPANGETFSGTISIPMALLEDSQSLSLSLTNYPEQQLKLKLTGIPVVR